MRRQQAKAEEIEGVASLFRAFWATHCETHLEAFSPPRPPQVPPIEPFKRAAAVKVRLAADLRGISVFKRAERKAIKARVAEAVDQEAEASDARKAEERAAHQQEVDVAYARFVSGDAEAVTEVLMVAFADNEAPVAVAGLDDHGVASLVMSVPQRDEIVPERIASETAAGNPTTKKMKVSDRNSFHTTAVLSHGLATAKEAFQVAPSLNAVALMGVHLDGGVLRPMLTLELDRSTFDALDWNDNTLESDRLLNGVGIETKGAAREMTTLKLGMRPEQIEFARSIASMLDAELDPATLRVPK